MQVFYIKVDKNKNLYLLKEKCILQKISKQMKECLISLYLNVANLDTNKATIKSLLNRNLITYDGTITEIGKRYVIANMSLTRQCVELSLELHELEILSGDSPENALLNHFQSQGYVGSSLEGFAMLTVLKALMLDNLEKYNIFESRADACTRYLESQFIILKDKSDELILSIRKTDKDMFIKNFHEIISQPFIRSEYPQLTIEFAVAVFDAVKTDTFIKLATQLALEPTLRNGWPDLTLIRNNVIHFIEVKTSDRLHCSQLVTIPILREILPFNISVYRLKNFTANIQT